VKESAFVLSD